MFTVYLAKHVFEPNVTLTATAPTYRAAVDLVCRVMEMPVFEDRPDSKGRIRVVAYEVLSDGTPSATILGPE